jgi:small multidrug resistance family-3 protein
MAWAVPAITVFLKGDLMALTTIAKSIALFAAAGLCEIGGGYLVWLWLRNGRATVFGALGAGALFLYGIIPTFQPAHFGRVYAAYGGVFVVLSLAWGWWIDGHRPDGYDLVGGLLCLVGVAVIMYSPRA